MTDFSALDPRVEAYLQQLVPPRHPVLERMEQRAAETDFPIIGPVVGQLCYMLTRAIGAMRVFEMGSGFGYSTAWFARAVRENGGGVVHHVVWDEELSAEARANMNELGLSGVVHFTVGEAVETLRGTDGIFDVVFNDIDKRAYPDSLPVIERKLRPGGLLIVDNMLWHGQIFDAEDRARSTEGVRAFTRLVTESPAWIASVVPIRDGVLVAQWNP